MCTLTCAQSSVYRRSVAVVSLTRLAVTAFGGVVRAARVKSGWHRRRHCRRVSAEVKYHDKTHYRYVNTVLFVMTPPLPVPAGPMHMSVQLFDRMCSHHI